MMIHLPLQTERVMLRDFEEADWEAVHCYASDPDVVHYMSWGPNTEEDTRGFIQRKLAEQRQAPRTRFDLAVMLRAEDRLVGTCGIVVSCPEHRGAWSGYCFNRDYWGHGYATEAARAIIAFGFEQLDLHRISAICDPRNTASARVMEKSGMRREGHLLKDLWQKGEWIDSYIYAILEQEWDPARA